MWIYFPETKRMTLEEIDCIFDGERHFVTEVTVGEVVNVGVEVGMEGKGGEKV